MEVFYSNKLLFKTFPQQPINQKDREAMSWDSNTRAWPVGRKKIPQPSPPPGEKSLVQMGKITYEDTKTPAQAASLHLKLIRFWRKTEKSISNLHISNISIEIVHKCFLHLYLWTFYTNKNQNTCGFTQKPNKSTNLRIFWKSLSFGTGGVPKLGGAGDSSPAPSW